MAVLALPARYNTLMPKQRDPEDLSVEELRRLLIEKRRAERQGHRERFRRTGRVIMLASDAPNTAFDPTSATPEEEEDEPAAPAAKRPPRRLMDNLLLLVEVGAVLGLFWVIFNGVQMMRTFNAEFNQALVQPTLTPTPLIVALVLPSGHTPPTSPGGSAPNDAEIPEHLRPLVQQLAAIPLPTPGPQQAIRLQIPALGVDAPVVQGDGWEQLKKGVGQHIGSVNPGESGNIVLSAHNDVFGELFRYLDRLKAGDQIIIHSNQRSYTYIVTTSEIVEPTRVDVMSSGRENAATLISCYPYLVDKKRIIVHAVLQEGGS